MEQDYYRILGIREDASEEEIKKRYRILAKKYHPDTNPGDGEAEQRFKEAGIAYAVLGDPKKRREYDQRRRAEKRTKEKRNYGKKENQQKKKANPIDTTELFEKFMGIKR